MEDDSWRYAELREKLNWLEWLAKVGMGLACVAVLVWILVAAVRAGGEAAAAAFFSGLLLLFVAVVSWIATLVATGVARVILDMESHARASRPRDDDR